MSLHDLDLYFRVALGNNSSRAVARELGVPQSLYHRAISRDTATLQTVRRWLDAWTAAGHDPVPAEVLSVMVSAPTTTPKTNK